MISIILMIICLNTKFQMNHELRNVISNWHY